MEHQIRFPHLGIVLKNVGDGINIGGFEIKYYGMIIATGFLLGLIVSYYAAKHENKFDPELSDHDDHSGDRRSKTLLCDLFMGLL